MKSEKFNKKLDQCINNSIINTYEEVRGYVNDCLIDIDFLLISECTELSKEEINNIAGQVKAYKKVIRFLESKEIELI